MTKEPTMSLEELGNIKTVKVYTQAYVDKQQERIADLEKENAVLKEKLAKETAQRIRNFHKAIEWKEKHRALQKENTELKEKLNNLASVAEVRLANWQKYEKENEELKKGLSVVNASNSFNKEQLTEAKDIIKALLKHTHGQNLNTQNDFDLYLGRIKQAEQFLKED